MKTYEERTVAVLQKANERRTRRRVITATALVLCVCIVAGIAIPYYSQPASIRKYMGSEYFQVIKAVKEAFPKSTFRGDITVDFWMEEEGSVVKDTFGPSLSAPGANGSRPDYSDGSNNNSSVEITDHQVQGVLEGDVIKRSQTHIFYLKDNCLEVYPIAGEDTKRMSYWKMTNYNGISYSNDREMYLSEDATRLTIIREGSGVIFQEKKHDSFVQVIVLDITDLRAIKQVSECYLTGSLSSTRMVGDQLMLFSRYCINYNYDFDDPFTFLPSYGPRDNMQTVPAEGIIIPDELVSRYYTVVTLFDTTDLSLVDCGAFMSYSAEVYVSKDRIYATRAYTTQENICDVAKATVSKTEIACMTYDENGLTNNGSFHVDGLVKNQYSMDEYDGVFRVVTSTNRWVRIYSPKVDAQGNTAPPNGNVTAQMLESTSSANLYCFAVDTWDQLALVETFAPNGETVESVRFDGKYAYVCTAVVVTLNDPVFFFDLSDLSNITYKDTGTIDGYSSSLIQLENGFLMGIGFDENRFMKVEIYTETADGVMSVCEYIHAGTFASTYKAYYIDRENNLFGIPVSDGYVLLYFDGYELMEVAKLKAYGSLEMTRGVVIDQVLYVFSPNYFAVESIG